MVFLSVYKDNITKMYSQLCSKNMIDGLENEKNVDEMTKLFEWKGTVIKVMISILLCLHAEDESDFFILIYYK